MRRQLKIMIVAAGTLVTPAPNSVQGQAAEPPVVPGNYWSGLDCTTRANAPWSARYTCRVTASRREELVGLTVKARSEALGMTMPGDECLGRITPERGAGPWNSRGGTSPCRVSLDAQARTFTWYSPACTSELEGERIKLNLKVEWQPPQWAERGWRINQWHDVWWDFTSVPC